MALLGIVRSLPSSVKSQHVVTGHAVPNQTSLSVKTEAKAASAEVVRHSPRAGVLRPPGRNWRFPDRYGTRSLTARVHPQRFAEG